MRVKTVMICAVTLALLTARAPRGTAEDREKKEIKPALLVIDVQNIWLPRMAEEDRRSAPQKINEAISLFREFGRFFGFRSCLSRMKDEREQRLFPF